MIQLDKKLNVVVTAGASGIGKAIVQKFIDQHCNVFTCDISEQLIEEFKVDIPEAYIEKADVSDFSSMQRFYKSVSSKVDHIDLLVCNAGIAGPTSRVEDIEASDWDKTISVNLNGMFYALKCAIPFIKKADGGSIVLISSSAAWFGYPYRSPYSASKWAVLGLMKTLAMELGPSGIRVNAICPGSVKGPRIDAVVRNEAILREVLEKDVREGYERQVSMRSFVDASDIADMILFLASSHGKMVSGQAIGVDGHTETLTQF